MLNLMVTFDTERIVTSNELLDIFWNVNNVGNASGSINESKSVNSTPLRVFPAVDPGPFWGSTPWGSSTWEATFQAPNVSFQTPAVHFGLVKIAGKERDSLGNYQAGSLIETDVTVNSTPTAITNIKRSTYSGSQQHFTFTESPQLKV